MLTGTNHPSVLQFTRQLAQLTAGNYQLTKMSPVTYLIKPQLHPVVIVFYLFHANREHFTPVNSGTGIKTIHIDEDSWMTKNAILFSRLAVLLGAGQKIHARKTVAARITQKTALAFQQEHHQYVALPGKYRYGLFLDGELVSVAVFSGGRRMRNQPEEYRSFELLSFCHRKGLLVVGGLTKLLRVFTNEFCPGDIMTYVDREWSDGEAFHRIGFEYAGSTGPQQFWVNRETFERYSETRLPDDILQCSAVQRIAKGYEPLQNDGSLKMVLPLRTT